MTALQFVQIEPVGRCNLRCPMCMAGFRRDLGPGPAFMDGELFRSVIDQCRSARRLHLQGLGEPLLHPEFFALARHASRRGLDVTVNTNGLLLDGESLQRCADAAIETVYLSLDGATAAAYEAIRRGGRFSRLRRTLAAVAARRDSRPEIIAVPLVMRQNIRELPAVVQLAADHGIRKVFVQNLCHSFDEPRLPAHYRPLREFYLRQNLFGEAARVKRFFERAREVARKAGVELHLPKAGSRTGRRGGGCDWPRRGIYISCRGDVMPCCMAGTPDRVTFGNVRSKPLASIWSGATIRSFRKALVSGAPPEICGGCSLYRGVF